MKPTWRCIFCLCRRCWLLTTQCKSNGVLLCVSRMRIMLWTHPGLHCLYYCWWFSTLWLIDCEFPLKKSNGVVQYTFRKKKKRQVRPVYIKSRLPKRFTGKAGQPHRPRDADTRFRRKVPTSPRYYELLGFLFFFCSFYRRRNDFRAHAWPRRDLAISFPSF